VNREDDPDLADEEPVLCVRRPRNRFDAACGSLCRPVLTWGSIELVFRLAAPL